MNHNGTVQGQLSSQENNLIHHTTQITHKII